MRATDGPRGVLEEVAPGFLVDVMLGSLARWLRILGYDAAYVREREPNDLIERALEEERVLLTRDRRLAARRKIGPHLLISVEDLGAQLRRVISETGLEPRTDRLFQRCVECNRELAALDYAQAAAMVPAYVAATQERFHRCPGCGRIYWRATHPERAIRRLREWGIELEVGESGE